MLYAIAMGQIKTSSLKFTAPKPLVSSKAKDNHCTRGTLQMIWDCQFQRPIDDSVKKFTKQLKTCAKTGGVNFEHLQ